MTLSTNAHLKSPFPSSVDELTIPNSHFVDYQIYRGMAPLDKLEEVLDFDVTDILIFKKQGRKEVDQEKQTLKDLGFDMRNLHHIPFKWKDYDSLQSACEQTIDALKIFREVKNSSNRKLFFHCTVGEDRTGYLSGIYRMLQHNITKKYAFKTEMCKKGYAKGNPNKPSFVVNSIRDELTVLYSLMADRVERGKIRLNYLSKRSCRFKKKEIIRAQQNSKKFRCQKQTILTTDENH